MVTKETETVWTCDLCGSRECTTRTPEGWRQFGPLHVCPGCLPRLNDLTRDDLNLEGE